MLVSVLLYCGSNSLDRIGVPVDFKGKIDGLEFELWLCLEKQSRISSFERETKR